MASQVLGDSPEGDSSASSFSSRYEVQQQLGKRAGRRTLLALDLQTQELVVIKLISFGNDFEWDDLKLFEREAKTLKALSHPAIPCYLDYFETDSPNLKGFALVQTYLEAKSLEEHLKAGRTFSEAEIEQLAKALLEILIYLHGRQPPVIHRDIKPSNILLTNRSGNSVGEVYLVDFGSVQTLAAREGGTITVVGTYGYMPPEQFGGRAVPASDLYSLGATMIYLATGQHPADLPQKDLRLQFEQAVNLSPKLSSWLQWMVEPSLDRRLNSAQQALQVLEQPQQWRQRSIYPTLLQKPVGSHIQLIKDVNFLEILLPRRGARLDRVGWTLLALLWNLASLSITGAFLSANTNLVSTLFLVFLWGVGIWVTLRKILFPVFGRTRIGLDRQHMTLAYELFDFKYKPRPVPKQYICKLVHTQRYSRLARLGGTIDLGYVIDEPRLIIWAGTKKYQLCGEKLVTDPELDWLAQELSDWLQLPVIRE
jgi:serine/threonine protein kinase